MEKDLLTLIPYQNEINFVMKNISRSDITELRNFPNPPPIVVKVMSAVSVIFNDKPSWDSAQKVL
jgi:hypothetical protein